MPTFTACLQTLLRHRSHVLIVASALLLAACQGEVTIDLIADAPADPDIQQVLVNVAGLEFRQDDGTVKTLEFSDSELIDLMDYLDSDTLRLFTDEELPDGTYTGVRLLFDTDANDDTAEVVDVDGNRSPLVTAAGDYASVDFSIEEDSSSSDSITLALDLRQSLTFDDDNDQYTLTPYLRSVMTQDAGQINGTVDIDCPTGNSLARNGAVYLFQGSDVVPDDRDGSGVEPYATTVVTLGQVDGQTGYVLASLPAGSYTIAVTCRGDEEDRTTSDDLDFQLVDNVTVRKDQALRKDFAD